MSVPLVPGEKCLYQVFYCLFQVHTDLTQLLEEVRRDQSMGLLLARAGVSREVIQLSSCPQ